MEATAAAVFNWAWPPSRPPSYSPPGSTVVAHRAASMAVRSSSSTRCALPLGVKAAIEVLAGDGVQVMKTIADAKQT